ncbi:MAG: hypothetical protein IPK82_34175 [Polyangiaceae bacterium]|nr:hypothetical protein [Polyangiaceae bacterium]
MKATQHGISEGESETIVRSAQNDNGESVALTSALGADYVLSCLKIEPMAPTFKAAFSPYPGNDEFKRLRETKSDIFVHRLRDSRMIAVPLTADAGLADLQELPVDQYLAVVRALISHRLPMILPDLKLQRRRVGLVRINRDVDLLDQVFRKAAILRSERLSGFHKYPRTILGIHVLRQHGIEPSLGMTVEFGQRHEIAPSAKQLLDRGFDLTDCVLFDPQKTGIDRWLGTVRGASGSYLKVETRSGLVNAYPEKYQVEARKDAFLRLMSQDLSRAEMAKLEGVEAQMLASNLAGVRYLRRLCKYAEEKKKHGVLDAGLHVRFRFSELVSINNRRGVDRLRASPLRFDPVDETATHPRAWEGIQKFGPFRRCTRDPRVLVVYPSGDESRVRRFVHQLFHSQPQRIGVRFGQGFLQTFGVEGLDLKKVSAKPFRGVEADAETYLNAIRDSWSPEWKPDIALIFLGEGSDETVSRAYLATKAQLLMLGVPSQEVRSETVRAGPVSLPFILENIAVALHAKLGGIPWTVGVREPNVREIVLGMAHAEIGARFAPKKRYMGITAVFAHDGSYIRAATSGRCEYEEYPAELARSVKSLLARLKRDQAWHQGEVVRLVTHTRKPLKNTDVALVVESALRELSAEISFQGAHLTLSRAHPWRVIEPQASGAPKSECVPARGTLVHLGPGQVLLCTKDGGMMLRATDPLPRPLKLELHGGSTYRRMVPLAQQVLDFTSMSWKSIRPISEPVTTYYAHLIADHLNWLSTTKGWSDETLETQLAGSCWFL